MEEHQKVQWPQDCALLEREDEENWLTIMLRYSAVLQEHTQLQQIPNKANLISFQNWRYFSLYTFIGYS